MASSDSSAKTPTPKGHRFWDLPDCRLDLNGSPLILGIINITPDSFSDAGEQPTTDQAIARGMRMVEEGADLLDIGGESTRPGALPVPVQEEISRVLPVVEGLAKRVKIPISVDTSKAEVARVCLDRGATIINDVTGLQGDSRMADVVGEFRAGAIIMHMKGNPQTMQNKPHYEEVVGEIGSYFRERMDTLTRNGIDRNRLVIDPGIGFGKTKEHNLEILRRLNEFQAFEVPLCLGVSRKSIMGKILDRPPAERLAGSLAVVCHALSQKAMQIVRVHDVAPTRDVLLMWKALNP